MEAYDRRNMEAAYAARDPSKRAPPIEDQVNDTGLGTQFRYVQAGHIGFLEVSKLVPFIPDPSLVVVRKANRITGGDGTMRELVEDALEDPTTQDGIKKAWRLFRFNLLMAIDSNPQHESLQISHREVEDFYEFLEGPKCMQKEPRPPPGVLISAERNFWKEVAIICHKGSSLQAAINNVKNDSLFWQRELYDKTMLLQLNSVGRSSSQAAASVAWTAQSRQDGNKGKGKNQSGQWRSEPYGGKSRGQSSWKGSGSSGW